MTTKYRAYLAASSRSTVIQSSILRKFIACICMHPPLFPAAFPLLIIEDWPRVGILSYQIRRLRNIFLRHSGTEKWRRGSRAPRLHHELHELHAPANSLTQSPSVPSSMPCTHQGLTLMLTLILTLILTLRTFIFSSPPFLRECFSTLLGRSIWTIWFALSRVVFPTSDRETALRWPNTRSSPNI